MVYPMKGEPQQWRLQEARIHQLEARVRELEGALGALADVAETHLLVGPQDYDSDSRSALAEAEIAARAALRTDHQGATDD